MLLITHYKVVTFFFVVIKSVLLSCTLAGMAGFTHANCIKTAATLTINGEVIISPSSTLKTVRA